MQKEEGKWWKQPHSNTLSIWCNTVSSKPNRSNMDYPHKGWVVYGARTSPLQAPFLIQPCKWASTYLLHQVALPDPLWFHAWWTDSRVHSSDAFSEELSLLWESRCLWAWRWGLFWNFSSAGDYMMTSFSPHWGDKSEKGTAQLNSPCFPSAGNSKVQLSQIFTHM